MRPGEPLPLSLIVPPGLTPDGTRTLTVLERTSVPVPWHWAQACSINIPEPRHCGQGEAKENTPWFWATVPEPRQVGQTVTGVPGSAPDP